ncbi:MAG: glycosyltransferase [Chloroflexi bacterium]|nr:glycosyltransferase [Chloroflexota bacterium]
MPDTKHVLTLTADAGFGHRSAANAIAAALQETHGRECTFKIVNPLGDERTPTLLRNSQSDYDRIARDLPGLYRLGYDLSDESITSRLMENALRTLLYPVLREIMLDQQPDVIISTYPLYQAALGAVFAITKTFVPLIAVVTDLVTVHQIWFSDDADVTIVPTPMVRELAIGAGLSPDKIQVIGIPVHPRIVQETREKAAIRAELGWDQDRTTILAVGSKRVEHLGSILKVLNHSGWPIQLVMAAGGDEEQYNELLKTEWHVPAHIYNFVKNMPTLMRAADAIICKAGGLIVTESLAAGLPLLLTDVIPGQETGNANYVVNGGAGELIEEPLQALESMAHWLSNDQALLKDRSANAVKLGRPRAAYDIVEQAWALAQRGPVKKESSQIVGLPNLIELFERFNVAWNEE